MYRDLWNSSILLFVLGAVSAVLGIIFHYYAQKTERYHGHAEARVIDIVAVPRKGKASLSEYHHRLAAVFEFYADGKPVKLMDPSNTYPCPYHKNETVQICYNPDNPEEFEIKKSNKWEKAAYRCNILSIVLLLLGCALFLYYAGRVGMS